ncbi:MAG TPA: trypsin-like peptidase domain-containing protein, partial [Thermoanaerobaculia bacterium]|nr:trypsin-like peptidase domain-containing protein [Thermoanaerobaculia bacterium]
MSHITGTIQTLSPSKVIGPASGDPPSSPGVWSFDFTPTAAPGGTKLAVLHFKNVSLPGTSRLEVDLGYATDVFTGADGAEFWTRPANVYPAALGGLDGKVPIRYITGGGAGSVELDQWGRGEQHAGETGHPSVSNSDPFQKDDVYAEPTYDPFWFCAPPPNWENAEDAIDPLRAHVARSVGMILSVEKSDFSGIIQLSTCSVTLIDSDKVITAGHCHTPAEALNSSVTFDWRLTADGKRPSPYACRFYRVKSVVKHHYAGGFDYSILQLAEAPAGVPVVQMRHDLPAVGEQIFGVHQPNGAPKKLSIPHPGFDTVVSSADMSITVPTNFHVSGGSSGSGLFDGSGRIVGVLSAGDPCSGGALSYFPTKNVLEDLVPTPPPPVTRDVMVVFDRSGSMSLDDGTGRTKIEAARDAVSLFVQLVKSSVGNRAGLVSFSTTASAPADFPIAAVTDANKLTLIGPPPFSGGKVGALAPGGATTIGGGLEAARLQFPAPGANPRAILLLTDGLQNTAPMIAAVEGALTGIDVHAIGFGTDASLDGALLTSLAMAHHGLYTRAANGLSLEKFFSHAFGNIFENGVLFDPEFDLSATDRESNPLPFNVCGEDTVTAVVGWTDKAGALRIHVRTPGGALITGASPGIVESSGRTWTFLRIPLPQGGERDGLWTLTVVRPGGDVEFLPPSPALRYFVSVVPSGGPRLRRLPDSRRYVTGQTINPLVELRFDDNTWPERIHKVEMTVSIPTVSAGTLLSRGGFRSPMIIDSDTIPSRQATLLALERQAERPVITYREETFELTSESQDTEGRFEEAGVFGKRLPDLLTAEGNYTFHCRATYGEGCTATRETLWSIHVDVGIDPSTTGFDPPVVTTNPDGSKNGVVTFTPRDR